MAPLLQGDPGMDPYGRSLTVAPGFDGTGTGDAPIAIGAPAADRPGPPSSRRPSGWHDGANHGFGGPTRSQVRPDSCVGGNLSSLGSIVTCRGDGTSPPLGPRSMYSPGRLGISPGFCSFAIGFSPLVGTIASLRRRPEWVSTALLVERTTRDGACQGLNHKMLP